jgi:hypothetical protein
VTVRVYGTIQKFANLGPEELIVHVCPACNKIVRGNYTVHEGRACCTKLIHRASVQPVRYVRKTTA